MEQLSARIAGRIFYLEIISLDDKDCYCYSVRCKASTVPPWSTVCFSAPANET